MIKYKNQVNETFTLEHPELTSYLYFPLANESGIMSSITPNLSGDSKISQNAFLMPPVSSENLHNDKSSRNIWCRINQSFWWSATGKSSKAQSELFSSDKEKTSLEAGFMHHKITRVSNFDLVSEITSFVPSSGEQMEITGITLTNHSDTPMTIEVLSAVPIYGRSADNIRDHRHVTALLNQIETTTHGVLVKPTMTFDERGHQVNQLVYGAFGGSDNEIPAGFIPTVEEFIGEGGSLENPRFLQDAMTLHGPNKSFEGFEALGGIAFEEKTIAPGESLFYVFILGYGESTKELEEKALTFMNRTSFEQSLDETKRYWREKVNISYSTGDENFNHWMKWVSFQPFLRRIYGCSFLPHHDYGKGGRGWRDLWQDCLALLIMDPKGVRKMLIANFGGVRLDGTNATIIGFEPGEFIADRNNITRVWMDHGMWPLLTTNLYIQQTGDLSILLEETSYFEDPQICRGEEKNPEWNPSNKNILMDKQGNPYKGTILEHILIEHLTAFYDVGEHGHMRLRGADWNDALDMAATNGESVAFTAMYAHNMEELATLLTELKNQGVQKIPLNKNLLMLLDDEGIQDPLKKRTWLRQYCLMNFTGEKAEVTLDQVILSLNSKAKTLKKNIRENEWIESKTGYSWYNGYYDNSGIKVEGDFERETRMMLTSQVFTVMSNTANDDQLKHIVEASDNFLYNASIGGYKLNSNFNEVKMDLGRMFGFAYGHKENGAVFSHMAVMYGYALYMRGQSKEAYKVISSLYNHCNDFEKSKIYPGIPEYIDPKGRGMYHYLTGSASWMLLTVISQMFGVSGKLGDLFFKPQLLREQFDKKGEAQLNLPFHERNLEVVYVNKKLLDPTSYHINSILINDKPYLFDSNHPSIRKQDIISLDSKEAHTIVVELS